MFSYTNPPPAYDETTIGPLNKDEKLNHTDPPPTYSEQTRAKVIDLCTQTMTFDTISQENPKKSKKTFTSRLKNITPKPVKQIASSILGVFKKKIDIDILPGYHELFQNADTLPHENKTTDPTTPEQK